MDTINLSIIRQAFASTVFTHKVQEVAADSAARKASVVKMLNIVVVSLVLFIHIFAALLHVDGLEYIAIAITLGEVIFLVYQLTFSYEEEMTIHKNSALQYMNLRERYKALIADIMSKQVNEETLIERRDLLQHEYQVINNLAPQTEDHHYTMAQERLNTAGVKDGEEYTWSDEEIDHFLPEELRLKK